MRIHLVVALAVTAVASLLPTSAEASFGLIGLDCAFVAVDDPTAEGGVRTAVVAGGPLMAAEDIRADVSARCTVQIGSEGETHGGPDACTTGSASIHMNSADVSLSAILPTVCSFFAHPGVPVFLCTQGTSRGVTYYKTPTSEWSTDPATPCDPAVEQEPVSARVPNVLDAASIMLLTLLDPAIQALSDLQAALVDPTLCPVLASLDRSPLDRYPNRIDPDGDMWFDFDLNGVFDFYEKYVECPPYAS